jgi:nitrite reductase (NADH) large subunit
MDVTIVHLMPHLMERHLDLPAADLLRRELERRGLHLYMPAQAVALTGQERVAGVRLADGTVLGADLVVIAVGVRPNTQLAREAGLRCDRGVLVNDTLMTFDPSIYAVGECVQHRGATFGLVAPLWDQARICAMQLAGQGIHAYRAADFPAQLKVGGIEVFSAGDFEDRPGRESLVMRDPGRGIYRRLVIEQARLRGVVIHGLRESLMFGESG